MPTVAELGQKVKAKYPGAYDDLPDDELGRRVKAKFPGSYDDFADSPVQAQSQIDPLQFIRFPLTGGAGSVRADRAVDAFPAMGGIVGGVALGVPGAAMYGGAMETLRRSLRGLPLDPKAIAIEGGKQAAFQGIGAGLGTGAAIASKAVGPLARGAAEALGSPFLRRAASMGRYALPIGGGIRGGIPGAMAGMAVPLAGRAALKVALSPKTEAFLGSMAFRTFARHSPQAAAAIIRQLLAEQPDATQTR